MVRGGFSNVRLEGHIDIISREEDDMSKAAKRYLSGCDNLKYLGKIKRYAPYRDVVGDDPYFLEFWKKNYPQTDFNKIYTRYGLAVPNHDAGFDSLRKYNKDQPLSLDKELWAMTFNWKLKHFHCMTGAKVLSHEETVQVIEKKASPGITLNGVTSETGFNTKSEWFECAENLVYCQKRWDEALKGQIYTLWTNNVKQELRPYEKISQNKLRTFVGSSADFVYLCQRVFYQMNHSLYESKGTWSFVGKTMFYRGWDRLARYLGKFKNVFELDESEYDCSLFREAMLGCAEFRKRCLHESVREKHSVLIDSLYMDIIYSFIVTTLGDVFMKNTGNPSGSLNTIADNTLILYRLLAYAWLKLCQENGFVHLMTQEMFEKHVHAALNGDDNTWSCSDGVVSWFHGESVSRIWSMIGIKTKSEHLGPRPLEECRFLSSGFRKVQGTYVPFPETEKIFAAMARNAFMLKRRRVNPRWSLLRACALRIQSFFNDECRVVLNDYIAWICKEYYSDLRLVDELDPFTFEDVWSVYKTDDEIINLYIGNESSSQGLKCIQLDKINHDYEIID